MSASVEEIFSIAPSAYPPKLKALKDRKKLVLLEEFKIRGKELQDEFRDDGARLDDDCRADKEEGREEHQEALQELQDEYQEARQELYEDRDDNIQSALDDLQTRYHDDRYDLQDEYKDLIHEIDDRCVDEKSELAGDRDRAMAELELERGEALGRLDAEMIDELLVSYQAYLERRALRELLDPVGVVPAGDWLIDALRASLANRWEVSSVHHPGVGVKVKLSLTASVTPETLDQALDEHDLDIPALPAAVRFRGVETSTEAAKLARDAGCFQEGFSMESLPEGFLLKGFSYLPADRVLKRFNTLSTADTDVTAALEDGTLVVTAY